jgi:hypothetical protein
MESKTAIIAALVISLYAAYRYLVGRLAKAQIEIVKRDNTIETIELERSVQELKDRAAREKEKTDEAISKYHTGGCNRCGATPCRCRN